MAVLWESPETFKLAFFLFQEITLITDVNVDFFLSCTVGFGKCRDTGAFHFSVEFSTLETPVALVYYTKKESRHTKLAIEDTL